MKKCNYCGADNDNYVSRCTGCGCDAFSPLQLEASAIVPKSSEAVKHEREIQRQEKERAERERQEQTESAAIAALNAPVTNTNNTASKAPWQLTVIVLLILIGIGMPFWSLLRPPQKWEYKTVTIHAETSILLGGNYGKLAAASIPIDERTFETLGKEGWELVSTFLELQTEHPNFGKEDYVTGLQPNVRPQRLVCIFKRPVSLLSQ